MRINTGLLATKIIDLFLRKLNQSSPTKRYFLELAQCSPVITSINNKDTAIIIQGPVLESTFDTIEFYRRIYPDIHIILSTWENDYSKIEDKSVKLSQLNVVIVLSSLPEKRGILNLNLQHETTISGLQKARELGCLFSLKTRTDQTIFDPNFISTLKALIEIFPANSTFQEKRIIGINENTFAFRPFSFSDMLQFGLTNDLISYWSCEKDMRSEQDWRKLYDQFYLGETSVKDYCELNYPEIYLFRKYLERNGLPCEITVNNYFKALKDLFIIIDSTLIGWNSSKYTSQIKIAYTEEKIVQRRLNFSDWLLIHQNKFYNEKFENFLNCTYKKSDLFL